MKKHIFSILTIISMILIVTISPKISKKHTNEGYFTQEFVEGIVMDIVEENLMEDPIVEGRYRGSQKLQVKILEGSEKSNTFSVYNSLSSLSNTYVEKGDKGIFTIREKDGNKVAWYYNPKRQTYLYIIGGAFATLLVLLGGMKGVKSILALVFSGTIIIYLLIPMIFSGGDPIIWSIISTAIITIVSFILISGFSRKTYIAMAGTLLGVTLAGSLSYIFGKLMGLNGLNMEGGESLIYIAKDYNIKVKGLLFASILIASLGAVMDVAMSIASSANEMYESNPNITPRELFKSSMNIGKDIMGTMTNTLILAFAGSSLPLIMMIWGYNMQYTQFINIAMISIEVLNALAGSIGIVATVPFTSLITIFLLKYKGE